VVNIIYSPNALDDLRQIGDYIEETLKNSLAALNMVRKIQTSIDRLADFPKVGAALSSITTVDSTYTA
jgi:plasmid stabilization system protein ParE